MPTPSRNTNGTTPCNRQLGRKATGRFFNAEKSKYNGPRKKRKARTSGTTGGTKKQTTRPPEDATPLAPKAPSLELPRFSVAPRPVTVTRETPPSQKRTVKPNPTAKTPVKHTGNTPIAKPVVDKKITRQPVKKTTETLTPKGSWTYDPNKVKGKGK